MLRSRSTLLILLALLVLLLAGVGTRVFFGWPRGEDDEDESPAAVARAVIRGGVPLQAALAASEQHGRAISGKFEVEDERFQLSVYTATGESYSEVLMDPRTGSVVKVRRLASGEDLTAAKTQNVALAMARVSLREATERAVNAPDLWP